MKRILIGALVLGFSIRVVLSPFFGHAWDMYIWIKSGRLTALEGVNIYLVKDLTDYPWGFYSYPPLWLYWLSIAALIGELIKGLNFLVFLIKLPVIISDVVIAFLLYRIGVEFGFSERRSMFLLYSWLFNPVVIYISSVWGMFDSLPVLTTLLALLFTIRNRITLPGILLGLGAALKLYPVLFIIPITAYSIKRLRQPLTYLLKRFIIPFFITVGIVSFPYIFTPYEFVGKILYHVNNIGQFTYWTAFAPLTPPTLLTVISSIAFIILLVIVHRQILSREDQGRHELITLFSATLLAFLATSPKVNVQYTLWVFPFLFLNLLMGGNREMRINLTLLFIAAITFIIATAVIPGMYDLNNLGRLSIISQQMQAGIVGAMIVTSALLGGTRFVALLINLLNLNVRTVWNFNRLAILSIILVFALFISFFPTIRGVTIPNHEVRVAVPESVEALFGLHDEFDIAGFQELYDVTHVVIPVGPDVINLYPEMGEEVDISKNSRFRLGIDSWKLGHVRELITALHSRGYKVLLGIYLKSYFHSIYFGIHGYNATWITELHPEITDQEGNIYFNRKITEGEYANITYAKFFSNYTSRLVNDLKFDGIYLMGVKWNNNNKEIWKSINQFLIEFSRDNNLKDKEVFLEIDPINLDSNYLNIYSRYVDYFVLQTDPWVRNIRDRERILGNYTIEYFAQKVREVVEIVDGVDILFGVYAMDFTEGWFTPAVELQSQINSFSMISGIDGFAIYHTNRYLPYRISVEKSR